MKHLNNNNNKNNYNYNSKNNTKKEEEKKMMINKYYNITEMIKDVTKVETQLSRSELSKVKTWDVFYIYKYSRDVDDAVLAVAARTWVELYIAERYEVDDWDTFVGILKEVYQRTRKELCEAVTEYIEKMMLDEISSGRTAEARMLIDEYNAEAAATYRDRSEALAADESAAAQAADEYADEVKYVDALNQVTDEFEDVRALNAQVEQARRARKELTFVDVLNSQAAKTDEELAADKLEDVQATEYEEAQATEHEATLRTAIRESYGSECLWWYDQYGDWDIF